MLLDLRRANAWWLAAAIAIGTCTFPLRTVRWRVLLRADDGGPLSWALLWQAVAAGFMANNLLPARAGEVTRAYLVQRGRAVRFTTALASIVVERVLDGTALVALLAVGLALPSSPLAAAVGGVPLARIAAWAAGLFGGLLVAALIVALHPGPWLTTLERLFRATLPPGAAARLTGLAENAVAALAALRSPARLAQVLAWSLVLWLVNAASFAACFRAFSLPVPWGGALLLQALVAFGVALPSSPGFFGPFEAVTRVTLGLYGIGADRAVSYAVAYHVGGFVPITLLGLHALSRNELGLRALRHVEAGSP